MLNRRSLLAAGAALPLAPAMARAAAHAGGTETAALPDARRFAVGEARVTTLSDGALQLDHTVLQGIDEAGFAEAMRAQFIEPADFRAAINGFLVTAGDQTVLVDAGAGDAMGDAGGKLMQNLEATGTAPEDITMILATHLHPDHVGGLLGRADMFANAQFAVAEDEVAFWTDDANMSEGTENFFMAARNVLDAFGDRVMRFSGETDLGAGLTTMPLPGHTPGHSGLMVSSGDAGLLIWADIVHVGPVQFANPDVTIGFDVNPEQAAETRASILDRVVADRMMIAGSHISFPGLGHVRAAGEGFELVEVPYPYGV